MSTALDPTEFESLLADARRPSGAVDLDRLIDLCRERRLDVAAVLREFARRNAEE